jgi:gliding motility-associated-like protein
MSRFYKFLPLFLLFLLGMISPSRASHMMGADMSYRCLGNGKYKITAKIYRDCRGISFNNPSFQAFAGLNGGNGCGSYNLSITRTSIRDVTPRCSSASKPCNPTNSNFTGEGIEEHTYETTVDFNASPLNNFVNKSTCCEVTFAIGQCCRNGAITTGPANNDFWSTCMINICNIQKTTKKCNSSPSLSNEPVGFLCCNQAYYFNNGAIDTTDFDSFGYKLVAGINSLPNTSVNYSSPFSPRYPMTPYCIPPGKVDCAPNPSTKPPRGFWLDTASGDIIFTPTKCDEVGIVVIEITEFRKDSATGKWLVIGKTRRDMQLIVKDDCGYNKSPTIEGITAHKVCEGDKICFTIEGRDETFAPYQTVPDTVQMKWNRGIPGATFTILNPKDREKKAEFCWQTKVGQASEVSYSFTVTATDDHCPKPSQAIRGFKVKVNPRAFSTRKYTPLKCGRFAWEATVPAGFKGIPTYRWSLRDSLGGREIYYSSKRTDTIKYTYGGKYIMVHTVNNSDNCPTIYRDTIILPDPPTAILATKDTFACFRTTMTLQPLILFAKAPYRYYWTRPTSHISGDTNLTLVIPNIDRDSTVIVRITDGDGCKFYDTATIYKKPLPVVDLGPNKRICTYDVATFDAGHSDTVYYNWNSGDTTRIINKNLKGTYIVTITDTTWLCKQKDTVELFVNDTVVSIAGPDKSICHQDTMLIAAQHRPVNLSAVYRWTNTTTNTPLGSNFSYKVSPRNPGSPGGTPVSYSYELYTRVTQGGVTCEDYDTLQIKVNSLPRVWWDPKPLKSQCHAFGDIPLYPFVNPKAGTGISVWSGTRRVRNNMVDSLAPNQFVYRTTKINNSTLQNGSFRQDKVYLQYKDTNNCINVDSTTQRINGTPVVQLQKKTYCQDLGKAPLANSIVRPQPGISVSISWRVLGSPSGVDPSSILYEDPVGTQRYWMKFGNPTEDNYSGTYTLEYCVEDRLTGCRKCDTTTVEIITEPQVRVTSPNPLCVNWDTIDLNDYVLVNNSKPNEGDGWFTILEYGYDRNDPKVKSTVLPKGHYFVPSFGANTWYIKYSNNGTGCLKEDSFYVYVNDTPDVVLLPPVTLCSIDPLLDLDSRIDGTKTRPLGQSSTWSGPQVSGNKFNPSILGTKNVEGPFSLKLVYTDNNGCSDDEFYRISVRMSPEVSITTPKPASACEGSDFTLRSTKKFSDEVSWKRISGSDGSINDSSRDDIVYTHGPQDQTTGKAWVKVSTVPEPNEVCPQSSDSIEIILHPYPEVSISQSQKGCVPLTANFSGTESKGIPSGQLKWRWDFGNGDTSDQQNPTGIKYPVQGKYTVQLKVTNTQGNCSVTVDSIEYVQAYPNPKALFRTEPSSKTTIALPKFRTINESTVEKSPFDPKMNYQWDFGTSYDPFDDTFTTIEPRYAYGKDTATYKIQLIVVSHPGGCRDTFTRLVFVGPDIIVWIPDVFTPDGSGPGKNNTFNVTISNQKGIKMSIYNRWGEKLYETDDINKGWNGTANGRECQTGVYVYHLEVTSLEDKVYKFDGTVTLLR